jgi:hypothetical protein
VESFGERNGERPTRRPGLIPPIVYGWGRDGYHRVVLGRAVGSGVLAGMTGVAVMTAAEKLEQVVTGRPDSLVPGRAAERLLGLAPATQSGVRPRMWVMHVGMAAGVGALRGVMAFAGLRGPWASLMFTVVRLTADQTVENWTGVGAPPWTWPRDELVVDVAGKAVYAFVTGLVADRLAASAGVSPGQRHAELAGGRRVHGVGPVPGGRLQPER